MHFTTKNNQNVNTIFTSISSHNLLISLYNSYNHKKIRHKVWEWYEFTRLYIVFRVPVGYPRVKIFTRVLPVGKILYTYPYPRVKFHTHTLTRRVGYSRVKLSSLFLPWFWISWPCSYLSPYSYGAYSITSPLAVVGQNSLVECHFLTPLFNHQSGGFINFFKRKCVVRQWSLESLIYALSYS